MTDIVMPRLSDSMEEGTIAAWLVADGAEVEAGQEIAEIESDKATVGHEAEASGVLRIVVAEGETVALGELIARIDVAGAPAPTMDLAPDSPTLEPGGPPATEATQPPSPSVDAETAGAPNGTRPKASPVARRIADRHGIDLSQVTGTGPAGRIMKADALEALPADDPESTPQVPVVAPDREEAPSAATPQDVVRQPSRIERLVAARMAQSRTQIPDFEVSVDVDMTNALAMRSELKAVVYAGAAVPSVNDLIVKACALALREHPRVNSAWTDDGIREHGRVNVGVAVSTEDGGLVVPVVTDADIATLGNIASRSRVLTGRARDGTITPAEMDGGTFTVSNLGMMGVTRFAAIITPGQGAILAVGATIERYLPVDAVPTARPVMTVTLCCDHRIVYGAHAAAFLTRVRALLEHPAALSY